MVLPSDVRKPTLEIQSIVTEIEKIKLEIIKDKTFVDTDIYLDGRSFVDCIFKNCRMFIKLGCFNIIGRIHLEGCEFIALPPAAGVKSISDILSLRAQGEKKS
jgi:hypothetical protein